MADSSAIARYLERRYPDPPLVPADPAARAYCGLLEEWADEALSLPIGGFKWLNPENHTAAVANTARELVGGPFQSLVGGLIGRRIRRRYRSWGYTQDALAHFEERMRTNLATLEALLEDRDYLLGRRRTIADVSAFAQLAWMRGYAEGRLLAEVPTVVAWLDRMESVPAISTALVA